MVSNSRSVGSTETISTGGANGRTKPEKKCQAPDSNGEQSMGEDKGWAHTGRSTALLHFLACITQRGRNRTYVLLASPHYPVKTGQNLFQNRGPEPGITPCGDRGAVLGH